MNISAIDCSPIKPQASFGNTEETKKSASDVKDVQKVLDLSNQIKDSFKKDVDENAPEAKNPVATAVSIAGAFLTMYALGRSAGKGAVELAKKIPAETTQKYASKLAGAKNVVSTKLTGVKDAVASKLPKVNLPKNEKVSKFFGDTVGKFAKSASEKVVSAYKANPEAFVKNAAGIAAAATIAPAVVAADGNKDGIADIAQKNVNAYSSALKTAEVFGEIASLLT